MNADTLIAVTREALLLMILTSAPPLLASLIVGVFMSVVQATTSIQENTLSVVPRLCTAAVTLVICGPWLGDQFSRFARQVFLLVPGVAS